MTSAIAGWDPQVMLLNMLPCSSASFTYTSEDPSSPLVIAENDSNLFYLYFYLYFL